MTDEYQIEIPQSFIALHLDPGCQRPNASRDHIASRYELCEDLATMLVDVALTNLALGPESDRTPVLERCRAGLLDSGSAVSEAEANWVVSRLAELLDWNVAG